MSAEQEAVCACGAPAASAPELAIKCFDCGAVRRVCRRCYAFVAGGEQVRQRPALTSFPWWSLVGHPEHPEPLSSRVGCADRDPLKRERPANIPPNEDRSLPGAGIGRVHPERRGEGRPG